MTDEAIKSLFTINSLATSIDKYNFRDKVIAYTNEGCLMLGTYLFRLTRGGDDVIDFSDYRGKIKESNSHEYYHSHSGTYRTKFNVLNYHNTKPLISVTSCELINLGGSNDIKSKFCKLSYSKKLEKVIRNIYDAFPARSKERTIASFMLSKTKIFKEMSDVADNIYFILTDTTGNSHLCSLSYKRIQAILVKKMEEYKDLIVERNNCLNNIQWTKLNEKTSIFYSDAQLSSYLQKSVEVVKIGRLVKKCAGDYFKDNHIELFVNAFNASLKSLSTYDFKVVEGKDITYWYSAKRYSSDEDGVLQKSCMRYANVMQRARLYEFLPVKMVVLLREGQLQARALIWTLTTGEQYLDRIYTTTEQQKSLVMKWAEDQGIKLQFNKWQSSRNDESKQTKDIYVAIDYDDIAARITKSGKKVGSPYFDSFTSIVANKKYLVKTAKNVVPTEDSIRHKYGTRGLPFDSNILYYLPAKSNNWIKEGFCLGLYYSDLNSIAQIPEKNAKWCKRYSVFIDSKLAIEYKGDWYNQYYLDKVKRDEAFEKERVKMDKKYQENLEKKALEVFESMGLSYSIGPTSNTGVQG